MSGRVKSDCGSGSSPFILKVDTEYVGDTYTDMFEIRTNDEYTYNYNVSTDEPVLNLEHKLNNVSGNLILRFLNPGVHEIRIDGKMPHLFYNKRQYRSDAAKITGIEQWGSIQWKNMSSMFKSSRNLDTYNAEDKPDLSNVKSMRNMFSCAEDFNADIGDWNTSNVEDMRGMFNGAESFNGEIGDWDTSNVEDMRGMFHSAESFNGKIGDWDTRNVEDMGSMFQSAESFNGKIGDWDTRNVEDMGSMFYSAESFNGEIGDWGTSNVEDMGWMFYGAESFNQDISSWCVSQLNREPHNFTRNAPIDGTSKVPTWDSSD